MVSAKDYPRVSRVQEKKNKKQTWQSILAVRQVALMQILLALGKIFFFFYLVGRSLASRSYWASENENALAPQEILLVLDGTFFEP